MQLIALLRPIYRIVTWELACPRARKNISMSNSAQRRLLKDLQRIQKEAGEEIIAAPRENNLLQWTASIEGIEKTPWEGGLYQLRLDFSENYPNKAPSVRFLTKMFHPNIYNDGRICLDMLQNQWSPVYDVWSILTAIRMLLADPNTLSPANHIASRLYLDNKTEYQRTVRELAQKSLEDDLENNEDAFLKAEPEQEPPSEEEKEEFEGIMPRRRRIHPRLNFPQIRGEEQEMDSEESPVRPISPIRPSTSFFDNRANEILPPYRRNFLQISLPSYIRDLPMFNVQNSQAEQQRPVSQEEGEVEADQSSIVQGGEEEQGQVQEVHEEQAQGEYAQQDEVQQEYASEQNQSGHVNSQEEDEPQPA